MERIVTVIFNPAIDRITSVARLLPEVKLSCEEPVYQPGGGGINVARVATTLGGNVTALFLAGGYTGEKFCDLLAQENIKMIPLKIVGQTRENLVIVDTAPVSNTVLACQVQECLFRIKDSIVDPKRLVVLPRPHLLAQI